MTEKKAEEAVVKAGEACDKAAELAWGVRMKAIQAAVDTYDTMALPAREAYEKAVQPAREAYEKVEKPAMEIYDKAVEPARDVRDNAIAAAVKAFEKVIPFDRRRKIQ